MRVLVEGYQSIGEPVEIIIDGLTVLTGESNLGKSAVVRAILGLLGNQSGRDFINVGSEECRVTVENQGHTVTWRKTKKTSEYSIDGEEFKKCGRGGPPEEVKCLGFFEVMAREKLYRPQLMRQFDTPFIISENSPRASAELLATSKYQQVITLAIKKVQKDQNSLAATIKVRESDLASLDVVLSHVLPFRDQINTSRDWVNETVTNWNAWHQHVTSVSGCRDRYYQARRQVEAVKDVSEVTVPEVPVQDGLQALRSIQGRWRQIVALQGIELPPEIPGVTPVSAVDRPVRLVALQMKWVYDHFVCQSLKTLPEVPEVPMELISDHVQRRTDLIDLRQAYRETVNAVAEATDKVAEVSDELDSVNFEIGRIIQELGYCPICQGGAMPGPSDHQDNCEVASQPVGEQVQTEP